MSGRAQKIFAELSDFFRAAARRLAAQFHGAPRTEPGAEARLNGLVGTPYWDAVSHPNDPGVTQVQAARRLGFRAQTDRVYQGVPVRLILPQRGGDLLIEQSTSFTETVVWNPGATQLNYPRHDIAT